MAAERQQAQQKGGDDGAFERMYGLKNDPVEDVSIIDESGKKDTDEGDEESDESEGGESADASETGEALEALADQDADKGDDGESELSDEDKEKQVKQKKKATTIAAAERRATAAEEQMRKFQAEADKLRNQLNTQMPQFWAELRAQQGKQQSTSTDDGDFPNIDDEAVVTGKELKGFIKGQAAKREQAESQQSTLKEKSQWVAMQPEIADVRKLSSDEGWSADQSVLSIPTDTVGLFFMGKAKLLEKKLAALEKTNKEAIAKAVADERKKLGNRKPIPETGGGNGSGAQKSVGGLAPKNDLERRFLKFMGPQARIVQHGR